MSDAQELKPFFENFTPSAKKLNELRGILEEEEYLLEEEDWITFSGDIGAGDWYQDVYVSFLDWRIEVVHEKGGGEGDGEEYYLILKITDAGALDSYWKIPGFYQSYRGSEQHWDEAFEVTPQEKTIVVWE